MTLDTAWEKVTPERAMSLDAFLRIGEGEISLLLQEGSKESPIVATFKYNKIAGAEGLTEAFYASQILTFPFKSTTIFLDDSSRYVLVPKDLEPQSQNPQWLRLALPLNNQQVITSPIESERLTLYWPVKQALYDFCQRSFPMASFSHPILPLITSATTYSRLKYPRVVLLYWYNDWLDIIHADSGVLKIANRYKARNEVDALYFLTTIWRQFGLSTEEDHLFIYSRLQDSTLLKKLLNHLEPSIRSIFIEEYPSLPEYLKDEKETLHLLPPELILSHLCAS